MTAAAVAPPSSRNAPCPCGSGQRYKDCHGALAAPLATTPEALRLQAEQAFASGQPGVAKSYLERALTLEVAFEIGRAHV